MQESTPTPPFTASLPEGMLDLTGLPTLAGAARTLFAQACPDLPEGPWYVLEYAEQEGTQELLASHPLDTLLMQNMRGEPGSNELLDAQRSVLSASSTSLDAADQYTAVPLTDIRDALAGITPQTVAAQFEVDQTTFWEVPEQLSLPNRRLGQELQMRASLADHAGLLQQVGALTPAATALIADIVAHPSWSNRLLARGVYRLDVYLAGSGAVVGLPGLLVLSTAPGGYSPALGYVTERKDTTGECVLYCPGYLGFVRRYDSLEEVLYAVRADLTGGYAPTWLRRLGPVAQAALLEEEQRPEYGYEVRATPIEGNPFEAQVQQQLDAWRENALAGAESFWSNPIGLDASLCKAVRQLHAFAQQHQAARQALWQDKVGLDAQQQVQQDQWLELLHNQQIVAGRYFAELPAFDSFAREQIQASLRTQDWDVDPATVDLTISIASYRPDVVESELAPGAVAVDPEPQVTTHTCSLLEYIAMRLDKASDANWTVELAEDDARSPGLKALATLAEQLNLQESYEQALRARLRRPEDEEAAALHDEGRQAAQEVFITRLRIDALLAVAKGELQQDDCDHVLSVLETAQAQASGSPAGHVEALVLSGNTLRDLLLFTLDDDASLIFYTPGHPSGRAFERFASAGALRSAMTAQLAGVDGPPGTLSDSPRYWLARFGKHQLDAAGAGLRSLAKGRGGSLLATLRVPEPLGKAMFDQRVRFLLAEGDASAVSDTELLLEQGLDYALLAFRVLSLLVPGRVMTMLDLTEVAIHLFNGYASYSAGQRHAAGEHLLEMLSSLSGLANARAPRLRAVGKASAPMHVQLDAGRLNITPVAKAAEPSGEMFRFTTGERAGLYVAEQRLYVELADGQRYPLREVIDLLDGSIARYLDDGEPVAAPATVEMLGLRVVREPDTEQWRVAPRLRLLGGADEPARAGAGQTLGMDGVTIKRGRGGEEFFVFEGAQRRRVEFELWTCSWFAPERDVYLRYDPALGYHVEQPIPTEPAGPQRRQQYREQFGLPFYPPLPAPRRPDSAEALPKQLHQVWIGSHASLIEHHELTLAHNAKLAKQSGYRLELHFYKDAGLLPESLQLLTLRKMFPDVTFTALSGEPFFKTFIADAAGEAFTHYLKKKTRNYAAACDSIRYRLVRELGGIYMDVDDQLSKPLPSLTLSPGQLAVGAVVESIALNFTGYNNSHFASLKGNALLDAVEREMVTRFKTTRWAAQRPKKDDEGFWPYMRDISRVTGPRLFTDVYSKANPRADAMRYAGPYVHELRRSSVIPEPQIREWVAQVQEEVTLLANYFEGGSTSSWMTTRR
ncbi:hypothetical protein HU719_004385 [Pseudomonas sp. SWRI107]|uniref:dermonecrotic toxin domain-containing protein n=1 Tax=Pseudomonas farsensis TaxID=2745492 RepID=UPI0016445015|nr:DUF6543 domain-containing protein [Pseudomonas farsensis]MBV4530646.1 hypothetical protein [Pseudomonas farsensis]